MVIEAEGPDGEGNGGDRRRVGFVRNWLVNLGFVLSFVQFALYLVSYLPIC